MATVSPVTEERRQLRRLREILLLEDRKALEELRDLLDDPQKLDAKVGPIIEERMQLWKVHFPREFQLAVEKIIDLKLQQSQEELVNILYPRLGMLIRKYIANEIQLLRERIEKQIRESFLGRLRARIAGIPSTSWGITHAEFSEVEEIYVIHRDSGLLIGSASSHQTIDREILAGMLTAIKMFMEDAFQRGEEEVELIEYSSYNILIHNFYNFYIALAVKGILSTELRQKLSQKVMALAAEMLNRDLRTIDAKFHYELGAQLERNFIRPQTIKENAE